MTAVSADYLPYKGVQCAVYVGHQLAGMLGCLAFLISVFSEPTIYQGLLLVSGLKPIVVLL